MPDYYYENLYSVKGYSLICGIDEAGRGPLAGLVVAATVILPPECRIEDLNDSKKLSAKKREELFDIILSKAVSVGIGSASNKEIDELNILQATFLAMKRAVDNMQVKPDFALIDGNRVPPQLEIPALSIVKGDGKSLSVAAASVIAKVTRDRYMDELDKIYPQYQFAKHKGYPTKLHYQLIKDYRFLYC